MLRHIKGLLAKPRKLRDFTWISNNIIEKLAAEGIKNTKELYEKAVNEKNCNTLANMLSVDKNEFLELVKETDLTRIQWVNSTFSRALYEAGYDTVDKVKIAHGETLFNKILEVNKAKNLYKGNIGLNDIKICIEAAGEVEQEIEY